jgi:hypothetical protein
MMMNQIGQPAASMIDSTCARLLRGVAGTLAHRRPCPQGLVRRGRAGHKPRSELLDVTHVLRSSTATSNWSRVGCDDAAAWCNVPVGATEVPSGSDTVCVESSTEPVDKPVEEFPAPTPSNESQRLFSSLLKN